MRRPLQTRRRRRLVLAGAAWALVLLLAPGFLLRDATPASSLLPTLPPTVGPTRLDGELSRVVGIVAGRGAAVRCWSTADWKTRADGPRGPRWTEPWGAYTSFDPFPAVNLAPNECVMLRLLERSAAPVWHSERRSVFAWSLHVLAHESVHVNGRLNEATADCWGMQVTEEAALALGRTRREGRFLARLYERVWYPRARPSYRSPECRDGGRLDLNPKSHVWP